MATSINNTIECNQPHANLDSYYGPYESVNEALQTLNSTTVNGVDYTKRHIGLTVGIMVSEPGGNGIIEYWFKNGTSDNDLVLKTSGGSLPGGVKIVTFDKNGGSGVQNSILTDKYSQVKLPDCTLTKTNDTFKKWQYNDVQYDAGDIVTIGSFTEVLAIWNSSPAPTVNYTVSWINGTHITSITGKYNGTTDIQSGTTQIPAGSTVTLTANIETGCQFSSWSNLPSGVSTTTNPITFTLNGNVKDVSAEAVPVVIPYTVNFHNEGEGFNDDTPIRGITEEGQEVIDGSKWNKGTTIILTANLESGYTVKWTGLEDESTDNPLIFTLNSDVNITATATKQIEADFKYCACGIDAQTDKPVVSKLGDWSESIRENPYDITIEGERKALYVIAPNGIVPMVIANNKEYSMNLIRDCEAEGVYEYYTQINWITSGTSETTGELKPNGYLMYVYIDNNESPVLKDSIRISFNGIEGE